jgi:hypothetical protein
MEIAFEALENANIPISKIKDGCLCRCRNGRRLLIADKGWGGLCLGFRGYCITDICSNLAYTRIYGTGVATTCTVTACGRISYIPW